MDDKITAALIGAGAGLLSGTLASLVAPWVNWGIEKRRQKTKRRLDFIKDWRRFIGSENFKLKDFTHSMTYTTMYGHLSEETIKMVEDGSNHFTENEIKRKLLNEITRIEKSGVYFELWITAIDHSCRYAMI